MTKVNKISAMLLAALAAASLLSCNKEEVAAPSGKTPIGFHCDDIWTKAGLISEVAQMQGDPEGFKVYAHGVFDVTNESYSFNRIVTYDTGATPGWKYQDQEYWLPTCSYTFRAYYPAKLAEIVTDISKEEYAINGFELGPQYREQQDILMATVNKTTTEVVNENNTFVMFTFKHLLSRLDVKLKVESGANAIDANVLAVAFLDTYQKANFNKGIWENQSGNLAIGGNMEGEGITLTSSDTSIFPEGLLAIPAHLEYGDASLYILAKITLPDETTMEKYWTLPLPEITWEPGKQYTYKATLTAEFNIEFSTPEVQSWVGEQLSGTVIIR